MDLHAWYCREKRHVEVRLPTGSEPSHATLRVYESFKFLKRVEMPLREPPHHSEAYHCSWLSPRDQALLEKTVDGLLSADYTTSS